MVVWRCLICLFGSHFFIATELCVHVLSVLPFPYHTEVSVPAVCFGELCQMTNLPTIWSWVILFPMRANLGRRPSRFHHSVRLSIGIVIKKLPSMLKNMLCWHNRIVFCSASRINFETKSLFDFRRQNKEIKRALGRIRTLSMYFLNSLSFSFVIRKMTGVD